MNQSFAAESGKTASALQADVQAWLRAHEAEMFAMLEQVVNIDSGSHYKAGVDRVCEAFRDHLSGWGIATEVFPQAKYGNCLQASIPGADASQTGYVLLLGHMDTVFPEGTARERPFRIEGTTAYGPGVADMKSGLVMNTFIARAFHELGGNTAPLRVLYTGDEEIASPASRGLTTEVARRALAVFNAEPGRITGNVVTGRKGAMFIDFEVDGIAAHAGTNHADGVSAIEALARKIIELHKLTGSAEGVTANVGTIRGGMSVNTVAPLAAAQLDVRFPGGVDHEQLHARIAQIIQSETIKCSCGRITHEGSFLPFTSSQASKQLLKAYQGQSLALGVAVQGEYAGGSADSGLTSAVGAPTLCGTGPVGGYYHTVKEMTRLETVVPRAQAIAMTILTGGAG